MNKEIRNVTKIMDCMTPGWKNDFDWNMLFAKHTLVYCYATLRRKGYLFLNEVYQQLGFPLTKEGQFLGWVCNDTIDEEFVWTIKPALENGNNNVVITFKNLCNIIFELPSEEEL